MTKQRTRQQGNTTYQGKCQLHLHLQIRSRDLEFFSVPSYRLSCLFMYLNSTSQTPLSNLTTCRLTLDCIRSRPLAKPDSSQRWPQAASLVSLCALSAHQHTRNSRSPSLRFRNIPPYQCRLYTSSMQNNENWTLEPSGSFSFRHVST